MRKLITAMNNIKKSASASVKSSGSSVKSSESKSTKEQVLREQAVIQSDKQPDNIAITEPSDKRASGWGFGWATAISNHTQSSSKSPSIPPYQEGSLSVGSNDETENINSASLDNNQESESAIDQDESNKKPNDGWMTWGRKLSKSQNISSDSLRKLFLDGKAQQQHQQQHHQQQQQPSNELLSKPKAIMTQDNQGKSIEIKNTRSMSWSFWNNTTNSDLENKFTEDAVLFEPSQPQENKANSKKSQAPKRPALPNIIVPNFDEVLPQESFISKLSHMVSHSYPKHLQRTKPKSFKRVLIIGVHGFFPNKMLRPLIGEPTGTSIKFANEAELAILEWSKKNNLDISIQKIALEKEGRVFERVDFFYNIMEKWKAEIQESDFIFFACHSQGTPVSILLLSRLIETGIITNDHFEKRIGILAMAGVNNGPYYGADQSFLVKAYSTIEHDSMKELFEFQNFNSNQSKEYLKSLRIIISNNTKICFVGSIDDQLVPLYSAIASHIEHPNIYRACYIDGGSNTPAFVSRVVAISLWLKNIGYTDHGIIKEISNSLAGPLTGGGHSKIYNDPKVYALALEFILSTNDLNVSNPQPVHFDQFDIKLLSGNPFHLPWCMRGLVFESIRHIPNGKEQIDKVSLEFDEWKPESKILKDLKYRLSAIKAKL